MSDQSLPEEVEERAIKAAQDVHVEGRGPAEVAQAAIAVVAPAIRSQERQRVKEALLGKKGLAAIQDAIHRERGRVPILSLMHALEAALNTLEEEG